MKDLQENPEKPNGKFDMDMATEAKKARCIKLYGLLAPLMTGGALQLMKAVGGSNGFGVGTKKSEARFKGKRHGTLESNHYMPSIVNEQGTILLRCVGGQLKSYWDRMLQRDPSLGHFHGGSW